jgi:replication fork clamp-binding protein CrfC
MLQRVLASQRETRADIREIRASLNRLETEVATASSRSSQLA